VDIFDIPIANITEQYLEYLDIMKALNINLAGDFFVMASTLIHIKSKMLLPIREDEEEDPRTELVEPLLEYMRLKEIAGELSERDMLERDVFVRRLTDPERAKMQKEGTGLEVNLFQLIDAFKRVVDQKVPGQPLRFGFQKWSLKEKTAFIMARLKAAEGLLFFDLFERDRTIPELIVTFLALLELVHSGLIRVYQPDPDKDIRIEACFENEQKSQPAV
jgi:segregation and condensation protein A